MKTLAEIYEHYKGPASYGDKGTIHSYIEIYEVLLAPYRQSAKLVLEIGVLGGHSIRMWEEYFDRAEVHGVDVSLKPLDMFDLTPMIAEQTHHISIFDATSPAQVEKHFNGKRFDVIIEDASHEFEHQMAIYANFKTHLNPGGLYIIEDIADLDRHRLDFERIDVNKTVRIIDCRHVKNRFDDVLVVIS